MKKFITILFLLLLVISAKNSSLFKVVARVDDKIITTQDVLNKFQSKDKKELLSNKRLFNKYLDIYIDEILILREFEKKGLTIPETIKDSFLENKIKSIGSRETFHIELQQNGIKLDEFLEKSLNQSKFSFLLSEQAREIFISKKDASKFYQSNKKLFEEGLVFKISFILLDSQKDNQKIFKQINHLDKKNVSIKKFHSLIDKYSLMKGNKSLELTSKDMRKEFFNLYSNLPEGVKLGITNIEKGRFTTIVFFEDIKSKGIVAFEKIQEDIRKKLKNEALKKLTQQYLKKLRNSVFIEHYD